MTQTSLEQANAEIAANVAASTAATAESVIGQEVENGVAAARKGKKLKKQADGTSKEESLTGYDWLDAIIGMIFKFLEMVGLEKAVAGFMKMPIPEHDEVKAVSGVVGKAVGAVMKDTKAQTSDELNAAIKSQVEKNLMNPENRKQYASFTDEQLSEIAAKTSEQAVGRLNGLFDEKGRIQNSGNDSPIVATAKNQLFQEMQSQLANPQTRKQLAAVLGKEDIKESDMAAVASVVGPTVAAIETDPARYNSRGAIADRILEDLSKNRSTIEATTGTKLSDAAITAAAYGMASKLADRKGLPADVSFQKKGAEAGEMLIKDIVASKAGDMADKAILENTALGVRAKFQDSFWTSALYNKNDMNIIDKYYDRTGNGKDKSNYKPNTLPDSHGELREAVDRINDFAAGKSSGLNDKQRTLVSKIIGETTAETVAQSPKPFADSAALAEALQQNVATRLKERKGDISKLGVSIDVINKTLEFDVLAAISSGIGEKVKESPDMVNELNGAQQILAQSRDGVMKAASAAANVNGNGVTGGDRADEALAQAGSKIGRSRG